MNKRIIQKICLMIQSKGGMIIDADFADPKQVEEADQKGLLLSNPKNGRRWIYVTSLVS
ncbi:MAG: hypothetical protein Q7J63_18730 [Rhodonellum sp.]|nr:hypothetical protein [Rhodonellum sp.]